MWLRRSRVRVPSATLSFAGKSSSLSSKYSCRLAPRRRICVLRFLVRQGIGTTTIRGPAKEALAEARVQIRDVFGSSARLMEADITAMLIGFEQVALAAIRPLESAVGMRNEKLANTSYRDDKALAKRRIAEADHELAFASSMIAEFVVTSATKPKVWLEDRMHSREGTAALPLPPSEQLSRYGLYEAQLRGTMWNIERQACSNMP